MSKPVILMVGKPNARVVARLEATVDLVHLAGPDAELPAGIAADTIAGIANFGRVTAGLMARLPKLGIVANFGVGYDGVDAVHAGTKGIVVTNTPDVLNDEVADTTIGLLINTIRQLPQAESWLRAGRWVKDGAFALSPLSLRGRHIGMYGLGRIGQEIARRLAVFGLRISYHTRNPRPDVAWTWQPSLKELAASVDTLIAIVPKTPDTFKTINAEILTALGPNGVFINVGRGWTVDEDALAQALATRTIAAAGLDVFQDEPHVPAALLALDNACLLPHVGSASVVTRQAMADLVADNILSFLKDGTVHTPVAETPFARKAARAG